MADPEAIKKAKGFAPYSDFSCAVVGSDGVRKTRWFNRTWPRSISMSTRGDDIMYIAADPPDISITNRCEHCGHGEMKERIAHSFDQAVQFGWLVEVFLEKT